MARAAVGVARGPSVSCPRRSPGSSAGSAAATGTRPEILIIDPILTAALVVLAGWVIDPALVTSQWQALAG
jgi:hypothetical protein